MEKQCKSTSCTEGAELTISAMDDDARACIGQQTYYFVRRLFHDPELRKLHAQKKAELQAAGYFDRFQGTVSPENVAPASVAPVPGLRRIEV